MDGHDYMYALSEMLDSAKEVIFILVRYLSLIIGDGLISLYLGLVVIARAVPKTSSCSERTVPC